MTVCIVPPPFSDTVMAHFFNPRNVGRLPAPCGEGEASDRAHGVTVRIHVAVVDGRVAQARFQTFGCVPAIAASSVVTELASGRTVDAARALTSEQLIEHLGGLPPERQFCARLAVDALRAALRDNDRRKEGST